MSVEIWEDLYSDKVNVKNFSDNSILINSSIFTNSLKLNEHQKWMKLIKIHKIHSFWSSNTILWKQTFLKSIKWIFFSIIFCVLDWFCFYCDDFKIDHQNFHHHFWYHSSYEIYSLNKWIWWSDKQSQTFNEWINCH